MAISLDLFLSTVRQAAELFANSLSDNEREYFRITQAETLVGNCGLSLRTGWSLWEMNTPLQRDAIKRNAIAHSDDVSHLVVHWARAMVKRRTVLSPVALRAVPCTMSTGPSSERRRWRLRDGRTGKG